MHTVGVMLAMLSAKRFLGVIMYVTCFGLLVVYCKKIAQHAMAAGVGDVRDLISEIPDLCNSQVAVATYHVCFFC